MDPVVSGHRPNVLLIITDDLAWGDLGCHGNTQVRTPNLDALHGQSARLTRYCSGPLCTPARAALMTGRHPYRTRAIDTYLGRSCLDPEEVTLASLLRQTSYRTGIFGKWHLGDCYPMRAIDMGFYEAVVHNGGGLVQPANFGRDDYFNPDLMHNGQLMPFKGYCTDIFTDEALRFIDSSADKPWFCYLATNAPHAPAIVADRWAQPHLDAGLPERTRLFRLFAAHQDWVDRFLADPTFFGVADTYGIELIHPVRQNRSPRQIGRKGLSNKRWIVGGKLAFVLNARGRVCAWSCATANVADQNFRPLVQRFEQQMIVLTDSGFHGREGDPSNMKVCKPRTWNCRMLIETVLAMLTTVCQLKRMRHRVWRYFHARLAWTMAAFNLLVTRPGDRRLSIAEFVF